MFDHCNADLINQAMLQWQGLFAGFLIPLPQTSGVYATAHRGQISLAQHKKAWKDGSLEAGKTRLELEPIQRAITCSRACVADTLRHTTDVIRVVAGGKRNLPQGLRKR